MDFWVRQAPEDFSDELDSLYFWLIAEPDLRGRVALRPAAPGTGKLDIATHTLEIALAPDNAPGQLVSALVSWLANRRASAQAPAPTTDEDGVESELPQGDSTPALRITLQVTRSDGASLELSTSQLDDLTPAELQAYVDQFTTPAVEHDRI